MLRYFVYVTVKKRIVLVLVKNVLAELALRAIVAPTGNNTIRGIFLSEHDLKLERTREKERRTRESK